MPNDVDDVEFEKKRKELALFNLRLVIVSGITKARSGPVDE